ncbi:recombinase RecT [Lactococcus lactis]
MTNEIQVTEAEKYQKAALNTLKRQVTMGVNIPKNFDAEGALGYTALTIAKSGFTISKEVIVETLIKIASKGLDPRKDQLYVIPNKKGEVMLMESYFGYEKLAYDISEIERGSVFAEVVRQGETVVFKGRTLEHEKSFEAIDNDIIGAYAKVKIRDEEIAHYMSAYQISKSWAKTNSLDKNFVEEQRHNNYGKTWTVKVADTSKIEKGKLTAFNKNQEDFPEEMCKRTVIKALLKPIVKSYAEPTVAAAIDNNQEETVIKEAEVLDADFLLEEANKSQDKPTLEEGQEQTDLAETETQNNEEQHDTSEDNEAPLAEELPLL